MTLEHQPSDEEGLDEPEFGNGDGILLLEEKDAWRQRVTLGEYLKLQKLPIFLTPGCGEGS